MVAARAAPLDHSSERCMNAAPGGHTRIYVSRCRYLEGVVTASYRNMDIRAGAWQTLSQPLSATGDDAPQQHAYSSRVAMRTSPHGDDRFAALLRRCDRRR
jgi:hypothetical protein